MPRLFREEAIRTDFGHLGQDRLFLTAIFNALVEELKRRSLNQWVITVGCLNGDDVHKGYAITELEKTRTSSPRV